jgi:hypothetical protein
MVETEGHESTKKFSRVRYVSLVVVVSLVAVILVLPITPANAGLAYHSECHAGSVLGYATLWTPWFILDSPYNGSAEATAAGADPIGNPVTSGPFTAMNGTAIAEFSLNNWTVSALSTGWVLGPGSNHACSGAYTASMDPRPISVRVGNGPRFLVNYTLLGPGNSSDAMQPTQVDMLGHSSVFFGIPFVDNDHFVDGCAKSSGLTQFVNATAAIVGVPFHLSGGNITVTLSMAVHANYVYRYPSGGGVWYVMVAPSGGFSFEWKACPG